MYKWSLALNLYGHLKQLSEESQELFLSCKVSYCSLIDKIENL